MNRRLGLESEPVLLEPTTLAILGIGANAVGGALSANPNQEVQSFGKFEAPRIAGRIEDEINSELARAKRIRDQPVNLPAIPSVIGQPTQFQLPGSGQIASLGIDGQAFDQMQAGRSAGFLRDPGGTTPPERPEVPDPRGNPGGPPPPGPSGDTDDPRLRDLSGDGEPNPTALASFQTTAGQPQIVETGGGPVQGALSRLSPENRDLMTRRVSSLLNDLRVNGRLTGRV